MPKFRKQETLPHSHLVIIGGGEDKKSDKKILSHFVELSGRDKSNIVVITAASSVQEEIWEIYERVFKDLGVKKCSKIALHNREDSNSAKFSQLIDAATGIFMTGGDQKKLMALIGGTAIDSAMHRAYIKRTACIGGTSAGASAMSEHMLAESTQEKIPAKGTVHLGAGLGLHRRIIIDQHFSERQRLGRLLAVVAQNPHLIGVGIDENTALVITFGSGFEVIGEGAVTIVDGREMMSNFAEIELEDHFELINMKLHLFPSGSRYNISDFNVESDKLKISSVLHEMTEIIINANNGKAVP